MGGFAWGLVMGPVSPDTGHREHTGCTAEPEAPDASVLPALPSPLRALLSPHSSSQQQEAGVIYLVQVASLCVSFQQDYPRGLGTPVCPMQIRAPPDLRSAFLTSPQDMPLLRHAPKGH